MAQEEFSTWHGTTIIGVKKNGKVVIAGDGQVSLGQTVIKERLRRFASCPRVGMM
jgi:ATP-dependent HslUV protease subunit HslV